MAFFDPETEIIKIPLCNGKWPLPEFCMCGTPMGTRSPFEWGKILPIKDWVHKCRKHCKIVYCDEKGNQITSTPEESVLLFTLLKGVRVWENEVSRYFGGKVNEFSFEGHTLKVSTEIEALPPPFDNPIFYSTGPQDVRNNGLCIYLKQSAIPKIPGILKKLLEGGFLEKPPTDRYDPDVYKRNDRKKIEVMTRILEPKDYSHMAKFESHFLSLRLKLENPRQPTPFECYFSWEDKIQKVELDPKVDNLQFSLPITVPSETKGKWRIEITKPEP